MNISKQAIEAGAAAAFECDSVYLWHGQYESTRELHRNKFAAGLTAALEHIIPEKCEPRDELWFAFMKGVDEHRGYHECLNYALAFLRGEGKQAAQTQEKSVNKALRDAMEQTMARGRDDEGVCLATRDANKELTEKRDALQATVDAKWSYRLTTPPPPDPPGISYPNLSETYKLEVIDTGHSDRILLLESKELGERIKQLEATVEKCRALYELAWAECLAWRKYDIESCEYACDPPTKEPEAHDAAREAAERAKGGGEPS